MIPGGTEVRSDYFLYDVCGNRWWKSLVGQPPIPSSGFIQQQDLPTGTGIWCPVRVETKYAPVKMRFEYTIYTRGSREATITGDVSINALFYNGGYPGSPTTATAAINGVYDDQNGIRQVVDGSPPIVVPPFVGPTASSTSLLLPVQPTQIGWGNPTSAQNVGIRIFTNILGELEGCLGGREPIIQIQLVATRP